MKHCPSYAGIWEDIYYFKFTRNWLQSLIESSFNENMVQLADLEFTKLIFPLAIWTCSLRRKEGSEWLLRDLTKTKSYTNLLQSKDYSGILRLIRRTLIQPKRRLIHLFHKLVYYQQSNLYSYYQSWYLLKGEKITEIYLWTRSCIFVLVKEDFKLLELLKSSHSVMSNAINYYCIYLNFKIFIINRIIDAISYFCYHHLLIFLFTVKMYLQY